MACLSLTFLGTIQFTLNGQPVQGFASNKVRALLTYLAVEATYAHRRETLASLFWADSSEQSARHSLRQALSNLRRVIGDRDASNPLIFTRYETVQFNSGSDHWCDVLAFTSLLQKCRDHAHPDHETCATCMQWLAQAAELYRGNFLEGFTLEGSLAFEEWVLVTRERLHGQALEVFSRLAHYHEHRQEYDQARHYARRQVEFEPWYEVAHRQLMRLLALCGHHSGALAQYEACRRILATELGVEPEAETTALYEAIKNRSFPSREFKLLTTNGAGEPCHSHPITDQHNLPPRLTPFIGRSAELAHLCDRLRDPNYRLVTLVGLGGIGKTRLALAAAEQLRSTFRHGVWFVPLTGATGDALCPVIPNEMNFTLATAIANALNLPFSNTGDTVVQVLDYLRDKTLLLVLDNVECVLTELDFILKILNVAPQVTILTTARERLKVQAEYTMRVEGLPVPTQVELPAATEYSSVQLFVERANRVPGGFILDARSLPIVIQICQWVEGMPLGIELAAAWGQQIPCGTLPHLIQRNLDFLATSMRDVPERHRSMRAVMESSWHLLSHREQILLARMSVFRGGFHQDAALAVTDATWLDLVALADKSLLRQVAPGYYEIHTLVRQFAAEKLQVLIQDGDTTLDDLQARHSTFYLTLMQQQIAAINDQADRSALTVVRGELANIRQAWCWAVENDKVAALEERVQALTHFYLRTGMYDEGETTYRLTVECKRAWSAMRTTDADIHTIVGRLLVEQARFLNEQGLFGPAMLVAQEAVQEAQQSQVSSIMAMGYVQWGRALYCQGRYREALAVLDLALPLARITDLSHVYIESLLNMGHVRWHLSHYADARHCFEQAFHICRATNDQWHIGAALSGLGQIALVQGDHPAANAVFSQALQRYHQLGRYLEEAAVLHNLGLTCMHQGDASATRTYLEQALHMFRQTGQRHGEARVMATLGMHWCYQREYTQACAYLESALQLSHTIGDPLGEVWILQVAGIVAMQLGHYPEARQHFTQALTTSRKLGSGLMEAELLALSGRLSFYMGDNNASHTCNRQALLLAQRLGLRRLKAMVLTNSGHVLLRQRCLREAADAYAQALTLQRLLGQVHVCPEPLAGLAHIAALTGSGQAQDYVEEGWYVLDQHALYGTFDPLCVYFAWYRILNERHDVRAAHVLNMARQALLACTSTIPAGYQQHLFLEHVFTDWTLPDNARDTLNRAVAVPEMAMAFSVRGC